MTPLGLARATVLLLLFESPALAANVVTEWNTVALGVTTATQPQGTNRAMAITHAAMFDALNAVARSYTPYLVQPSAPEGASADAAAATAAHDVLLWLYPAQKAAIDAALQTSLARIPAGQSRQDGVQLGRTVAARYVAVRSKDGADRKPEMPAGTERGAWRPTPPAMEPFASIVWAEVRPFILTSPTEVTPPGPPSLDSPEYARDLEEVRRLGGRDSKERTADQTSAAIFSLMKGAELWNAAAQAAVDANGTSSLASGRIFALLNMSMVDATIAGWAVKKKYLRWRPITAIRTGGAKPDAAWEPLLVTPAHPDYVSGHCITAGAAARTLSLLFGNDGVPFSATFGGNLGLTRSYPGFSAAEHELENARIWAGIHTRSADEHGTQMGRRIGELAVERLMRPARALTRSER